MKICFKKSFLNQNGQAAVLFALIVTIIICFLGLAIDVSQVTYHKQQMQNAIDLSVLAGAQELINNPGNAVQVVKDYGERNGLNRGSMDVKVNYKGDKNKIYGEISETIQLWFMPIIGIKTSIIKVSAAAQASSISDPVFDYLIFSASQSTKFTIPGSNMVFDGKVHINSDITIPGADNIFTSALEIVGANNIGSRNNVAQGNLINPASIINIPQYDINELKAKATQVYNGNITLSNIDLNGIIFIDGDASLSAKQVSGKGTIIATGNISIPGSGFEYKNTDSRIAIYSLKNITIPGSNNKVEGIFYAPNGKITIPGSYNTFYGSLIAQYFAMPGSGNKFIYDTKAKDGVGGSNKITVKLIE